MWLPDLSNRDTDMSIRNRAFLLALGLTVFGFGQPGISYAQQVVDQDAVVDDIESLDDVDQRTPLKTAQGFMRLAELGEFESAAEYLDLRYLPDDLGEADGASLADRLYIVISRKMRIDFGSLSDAPEGVDGDGLPKYRDLLGTLDTQQGELSIYLQLIPGKKDTRIWKISNASVAQIPQLYKEYGYIPIVETVRHIIPRGSFLGAEFFKWTIALLAGFGAVLSWLIIAWPLSNFLTRRNASHIDRVKQYLTRPIPMLVFMLVGVTVLKDLGLGLTASRIVDGGTLITLATVWLLFATTNLLRDLYTQFLRVRGRDSGLMLVRPLASTAKALIAALATVVWLDNVGVNVTALVAGLGVGGIAVALVLQKPLEDIMGAITLYTQQPVTVGQFCTCGDITGTVEEINLRSTHIRTISNTVVVVPNALFATASIENIAERRHILHRQTVRLALDTSESIVRSALQDLLKMLMGTAKISEDSARVNLIGFGEYSIDLEVFAYIDTKDWIEFLAIAEEINLGTINVIERNGAKLAERPY
jgi:MscS family membrane protein